PNPVESTRRRPLRRTHREGSSILPGCKGPGCGSAMDVVAGSRWSSAGIEEDESRSTCRLAQFVHDDADSVEGEAAATKIIVDLLLSLQQVGVVVQPIPPCGPYLAGPFEHLIVCRL